MSKESSEKKSWLYICHSGAETNKYHASQLKNIMHQTMDCSRFVGVERFNPISLFVFYNVHALSGFVPKLTIYLCILVTAFVFTSNNDAAFIIYDETCFFYTHHISHTLPKEN